METKKKRDFKREGKFYVYILKCQDGTFYTGYTPNINKRIKLHNAGRGAKYTRDRRPVKLVYAKEHRYYKNALYAERSLKNLRRSQKEELIRIYEKNKNNI